MENIENFLETAGFDACAVDGNGLEEIYTNIWSAEFVIKKEKTSYGSATKIFRNGALIFSGNEDYALQNLKTFANLGGI